MNECKKEKRGGICFYNCDNIQFMKTKPDKYYDLAIVDPPYNIVSQQKRGIGSRIDASGKMNDWNNQKPKPEYYKELFRTSKYQIIWGANNFELPPSEYFIIWDKQQTVPNFASAEYAWTNIKMPAKVFRYSIHQHNCDKGEKIHPTMKPIKLYRWLLQNYAEKGFKILDTHGGSHTHAIAADMEGFELDIIEIDEKYFKDGLNAFDMYKRQLKLF
jgi:site-specific DNA-methyltransferase (adenine-specific)